MRGTSESSKGRGSLVADAVLASFLTTPFLVPLWCDTDIRTNDAPVAALAAPPPPAHPAAAHADPAAATAQHDRLAERLDGQPAPPPAVSPPLAAAPASTTSQPPPSTTSDAPRAVRFRPSATNEWDRMPAEIQNKILAHAGVLTLWVNGRIDDANLDVDQFKSMLVDVFELDWQGDLTTLRIERFYIKYFEPFWRMRSRSMYARVKGLDIDFLDEFLDQAAILNGWTDLLDFDRPKELSINAAACGSIGMLQHLIDERKVASLESEHAEMASYGGHLDLLQWLHERMPEGSWEPIVMDRAAWMGKFDCIKWLHNNRIEGCTTEAIDWAAGSGRLDVVKWLHTNRTEGCTTKAMDGAAMSGHLDVVKWLHENRTEGCTTNAMDEAAKNGRLDVVEWLHTNRTEGCTTKAMDGAAQYGRLDVVKWLHANRTKGCTTEAIRSAAQNGHIDVVDWLHRNRAECNIADAARSAAQFGHLNIVQLAHVLAPDAINVDVAHAAATDGGLSVLDWIVDNTAVWPTEDSITSAIRYGRFCVLSWFRRRMPEAFRAHAMSKVGNESANDVIDWLDLEKLLGNGFCALRAAIDERQIKVLKWMLEHMPNERWEQFGLGRAREIFNAA
ncbi:hypothetical protein HK105_206741 [Polyrhizophydium stewartii]|uniref:Ankyrin repeat protein n=1 Tax=Polyrhizophydium stewartii TaxID=2732419 RepID=A0ABR4N2H5_9FUNG